MSVSFPRNEIPTSLSSLHDRRFRRGLHVLRLLIPATKRRVHVFFLQISSQCYPDYIKGVWKNIDKICIEQFFNFISTLSKF